MPVRLWQWHAPRANRWERLCVDGGRLGVQWLDADDAATVVLAAGQARWIAPGLRWRIVQVDPDSRFHLEIHADESSPASAPQPVRAAWLDELPCWQVDDAAALAPVLAALGPGQRGLLRAGATVQPALATALAASAGRLSWHPLASDDDGLVAVLACSQQAIDLRQYLGRDHALIEAVLAGALRGDGEHAQWLRNLLARHLVIEEKMLFPAWLAAGGNPGWERGLRNEHARLREDLLRLDDPSVQRRFLLLLDGHDEKEEQIVYPDLLARIEASAADLRAAVLQLGVVA